MQSTLNTFELLVMYMLILKEHTVLHTYKKSTLMIVSYFPLVFFFLLQSFMTTIEYSLITVTSF